MEIIFPGFGERVPQSAANLKYMVGEILSDCRTKLLDAVLRALRFNCSAMCSHSCNCMPEAQEAVDYLRKMGRFESVTSFGDNLNDKALAEASDYFYAVSNAQQEIKLMASAVIPSNDEDGVARFIEQMMLAGERS
jgi:hypothetical protein